MKGVPPYDIGYLGDENYSKHPFWDIVSEQYEQVLVVPGNHDGLPQDSVQGRNT